MLRPDQFVSIGFGLVFLGLIIWTVVQHKLPLLCSACDTSSADVGPIFKCVPSNSGKGSMYCRTSKIVDGVVSEILDIDKETIMQILEDIPELLREGFEEIYKIVADGMEEAMGFVRDFTSMIREHIASILAKIWTSGEQMISTVYQTLIQPAMQFLEDNIIQPLKQILKLLVAFKGQIRQTLTDFFAQTEGIATEVIDKILDTFDAQLKQVPESMKKMMNIVASMGEQVNDTTDSLVNHVNQTVNKTSQIFKSTQEGVTDTIDDVVGKLNNLFDSIESEVNKQISTLTDAVEMFSKQIESVVGEIERVGALTNDAQAKIQATTQQVTQVTQQVVSQIEKVQQITNQVQSQYEQVNRQFSQVTDQFGKVTGQVDDFGKQMNMINSQINGFTDQFGKVQNQFDTVNRQFSQVTDQFGKVTGQFDDFGKQMNTINSQVSSFTDQFGKVQDQFTDVNRKITQVTDQFGKIENQINQFGGQVNTVTNQVTQVTDQFGKVQKDVQNVQAFVTSSTQQISQLKGQIDSVMSAVQGFVSADTFNDAQKRMQAALDSLTDSLARVERISKAGTEAVHNQLNAITSQFDKVVDAVSSALNSATKQVNSVISVVNVVRSAWNSFRSFKLEKKFRIAGSSYSINFGKPFGSLPSIPALDKVDAIEFGGNTSKDALVGQVYMKGSGKSIQFCKKDWSGNEFCANLVDFGAHYDEAGVCSKDGDLCISHEEFAALMPNVSDKDYYATITREPFINNGKELCQNSMAGLVCAPVSDMDAGKEPCQTYKHPITGETRKTCLSQEEFGRALYWNNLRPMNEQQMYKGLLGVSRTKGTYSPPFASFPSPQQITIGIIPFNREYVIQVPAGSYSLHQLGSLLNPGGENTRPPFSIHFDIAYRVFVLQTPYMTQKIYINHGRSTPALLATLGFDNPSTGQARDVRIMGDEVRIAEDVLSGALGAPAFKFPRLDKIVPKFPSIDLPTLPKLPGINVTAAQDVLNNIPMPNLTSLPGVTTEAIERMKRVYMSAFNPIVDSIENIILFIEGIFGAAETFFNQFFRVEALCKAIGINDADSSLGCPNLTQEQLKVGIQLRLGAKLDKVGASVSEPKCTWMGLVKSLGQGVQGVILDFIDNDFMPLLDQFWNKIVTLVEEGFQDVKKVVMQSLVAMGPIFLRLFEFVKKQATEAAKKAVEYSGYIILSFAQKFADELLTWMIPYSPTARLNVFALLFIILMMLTVLSPYLMVIRNVWTAFPQWLQWIVWGGVAAGWTYLLSRAAALRAAEASTAPSSSSS